MRPGAHFPLFLAALLCGGAGICRAAEPGARQGAYLRVLGTAQDGGIPHAACDGPHCTAAREDPARRRLVASLAIVLPGAGEVYLVDAGPDLREQLDRLRDVRRPPREGVDRSPVDGAFLTHAHIGHYLGLAFFGYEAVHTRDLPLYVSARMAAFLRDNGPWSQLVSLDNVRLVEVEPGSPVALGDGVSVTALRVPHRDELSDTLAFRFEGPGQRVLYLPDCDPWRSWGSAAEELVRSVDVALLDGTFYSLGELPGRSIEEIGHPLISDSMDRFESLVRAGDTRIYFTHLNHSNPVLEPDGPERREVERRGFRVLEDLDEIGL